jgi:salicylate hydroxylase
VACAPKHLQVLAAEDGRQLGSLRLGRVFSQRYGSDYLTLHRADLQQLLLDAALASGAELTLETTLKSIAETADGISARAINGTQFTADALLGCDGLWSHVRQHLLGDGRPLATGHLAYRTLIAAADMPPGLAGKLPLDQVSVWLGPQRHAVAYPVRGGALLNLVVIVHGSAAEDVESWDHAVHAQNLLSRLSGGHHVLQDLIALAPQWKRWVLNDRAPVQGPAQMARGRIALLGDAAHPMRPYLAQGAAMALEDARALGQVLEQMPSQVAMAALPQALSRYAEQRWQRNARVQAQSRRNGWIFHADGLLRHGRNLAMASLGERLLDNRWLYAG